MSIQKDQVLIMVFSYFHKCDILLVTAIPQALRDGDYLVLQVKVVRIIVNFNQENYLELNEHELATYHYRRIFSFVHRIVQKI